MITRETLTRPYLTLRAGTLAPLAWVLKGRAVRNIDPAKIGKILFIRVDRIGDMALSTPALRALKEGFPAAELTVLAGPSAAPLLENNPSVDRVMIYDRSAGLRRRLALAGRLRRLNFDLVVDPYDDRELQTAWLAGFTGAPFRVGYPCGGRECFFTLVVDRPAESGHLVDVVLRAVESLGLSIRSRDPELFLTAQEMQEAGHWLAGHGLGGKPLIGFHPGAFYETQRWPVEYFGELLHLVQSQGRADTVLFGGPGDEGIVRKIEQRSRRAFPVLVAGSLRHFCAVLSRCKLLVCNNTGPLHVASALGVQTLSFMGPTDRVKWMPVGRHHRVLRMDELPCIGCNSGLCRRGELECMKRITPEMALSAITVELGA